MLAAPARTNVVTHHLVGHLLERRDHIAATEGKDRIQMHGRTAAGHLTGHDTIDRAALEQGISQLPDRLRGAALAHADQHTAVADRHDVATLQRGQRMILEGIAPYRLDLAGKCWMEAVDSGH